MSVSISISNHIMSPLTPPPQPTWRKSSPCGDTPTPCWTPQRAWTRPWWFTVAPAWAALALSSSLSWWSAAWSRTRWVDDQSEWVTSCRLPHRPSLLSHSQWRCPPCCWNWGGRGCWWFRPSPSTSLSTRSSSSSTRTPASFELAQTAALCGSTVAKVTQKIFQKWGVTLLYLHPLTVGTETQPGCCFLDLNPPITPLTSGEPASFCPPGGERVFSVRAWGLTFLSTAVI